MLEKAPPTTSREIRRDSGLRRIVKLAEEGLVRLDQEIRTSEVKTGLDITGPYWFLAMIEVYRGRIRFLHGSQRVSAPGRRFGFFMPSYAVAQVELFRSHSFSVALASRRRLPRDLPREPVLFTPHKWQYPGSLEKAIQLIRKSRGFVSVSRAPAPSPLAERVKKAIDHSYRTSKPLSETARELRIAPATMSRYFKKDYGLPPVKYRHGIRIMDGMMRLLEGQAVKDVFQEVGFEDLSRFYKHFSALACAAPGRYHLKKSKNTKTWGTGA